MANKIIKIRNLKEFRARYKRKAKNMIKVKSQTTKTASKIMELTAKRFAPMDSGKIINAIKTNKLGKFGHRTLCDAKSMNGFPYPLWVNREPGFRKVKMWWNSYKPTMYGDGTHKVSSVVVPFWDAAFDIAKASARENTISVFRRVVIMQK